MVSVPLMEAYESLRPYGFFIIILASLTGLLAQVYLPLMRFFLVLLFSLL